MATVKYVSRKVKMSYKGVACLAVRHSYKLDKNDVNEVHVTCN